LKQEQTKKVKVIGRYEKTNVADLAKTSEFQLSANFPPRDSEIAGNRTILSLGR
jgi:hypothetical protein